MTPGGEVLESEKWQILFDNESSLSEGLYEGYINLRLRLKTRESPQKFISDETLSNLKVDLVDLGKWRRYKKLVKELEGG